MKLKIICLLFSLSAASIVHAQKTFDESGFFTSIASEDLALVNKQLSILKKSSINEKDAYEGALLMKKAGMITKLKAKLDSFKQGHEKLENAIAKDPNNANYRFLRIIIQENAPGILNYNDNIDSDCKYIQQSFNSLSPLLQTFIRDYSKKSKALRLEDKMAVKQ